MLRRIHLLSLGTIAGLSIVVALVNACLLKQDSHYCSSNADCLQFGADYICQVEPLSSSLPGNTCVSADAMISQCDMECVNPTPICDLEDHECRQCDSGECSGNTPICLADICVKCSGTSSCVLEDKCTEGDLGCVCRTDGECGACTRDSECDSAICADGTCVEGDQVAYVAMNGNANADCGIGGNLPCAKINDALLRGTPWVRIAKGAYTTEVVNISRAVNIVGEYNDDGSIGVMIGPVAAGQRILPISGATAIVSIEGVSLRGASGGLVSSISCESDATLRITRTDISNNTTGAIGLYAGTGCKLFMERVRVDSNSGGGLVISDAEFRLQNNIVTQHTGVGISIGNPRMQSVFEFNTVVNNGTGISCNGGMISASHNIVWNTTTDVSNCYDLMTEDFSIIKSRDMEAIPDPKLDSTYHLTAESPAIDKGSRAALDVTEDFDGQVRPNGTAADIGADEYYPR